MPGRWLNDDRAICIVQFSWTVCVCFSTASTGSGLTLAASSASQATVSAAAVSSTIGVSQPTSACTAVCSSTCAAVVTSSTSSSVSQLPLCASSTSSTSSTPASSTLPVPLDSVMAALGSMESIAMIASQLVPLLASMDLGMMMQMLQVANPPLATALSAYYLQSAVTADVQQMSAALSQLLTAASAADVPCASGALQNQANVCAISSSGTSVEVVDAACVSSSSSVQLMDPPCASGALQNQADVCVTSTNASVVVTGAMDAVRCASTTSCDSLQSSIYSSESSQVDLNTSTQRNQLKPCRKSPERNIFDALDTCRPSSTASSMADESRLEVQATASTSGPLVYNCHLCTFRSSHRRRFAEHLSLEFCTTDITRMAAQPSGKQSTGRKRCSHCAFSTYLSEEFDQHVQIHQSSSVRPCAYCGYIGSSVDALRLHFKRRHPTKSFFFHKRAFRQKSRAEHHRDDRSDMSQLQSVNLDPVVKLFKVDLCDISMV